MSNSDEEGEIFPDNNVTNYEFMNQADEHVSFACLPLLWQKDVAVGDRNTGVYLSGSSDNGLGRMYKEVVGWRFELSYVLPEISVRCKGDGWVNLIKPRRLYEAQVRSILITVNWLHFIKHNRDSTEDMIWSHLSKVFNNYEIAPSENDCMNHIPLIKDAASNDQFLKDSEFIQRILSGPSTPRNMLEAEVVPAARPDFIADDEMDDLDGDDEPCEEEDDIFDTCCSLCDNGGDILCVCFSEFLPQYSCEGRCMRSFHGSRQIGDSGEQLCEGIGLSEAEIRALSRFECKNCQYHRHQCFICGILGPSDVLAGNAVVFPCIAGNCGRFYHPKCVVNVLEQRKEAPIENLEDKIAAGEPFVCPAHRCLSCKQIENRTVPELQFAVCRRCPISYHRKCLPSEIKFDTEAYTDVLPRAWDGLLPKRILIYCLNHEIIPSLGTPQRNHIIFSQLKFKIRTPETLKTGSTIEQRKRKFDHINQLGETAVTNTKLTVEQKNRKFDHSNQLSETVVGNTKKQAASEPVRIVDKHIGGSTCDGHKNVYPSKLTSASPHLSKPCTASDVGGDPGFRQRKFSSVKKISDIKPGNAHLNGEKLNDPHSIKNQSLPNDVVDIEMETRITNLMKKVKAEFNVDEFMEQKAIPSIYKSSRDMIDKHMTEGRLKGAVNAVKGALKKLNDGCSVDDAMAVCDPTVLRQVSAWKNKLKIYLAPFMHGMHYSSFGRHFTKSEKLQEIVNRLHNYVKDGDMIVDFCCGANEFSCLMKQKLDSVGKKKCLYKNFDLFPTKNDFNFEQKNWYTVNPNELPSGSQLIIGLNPPFGFKAGLANKFINKALQFRPKLMILIVPPETQRLDQKRHLRYDLLWEDQNLLAGEAFYLPGAFSTPDKQIPQQNTITPPLFLWSHPDWTQKHRQIADQCGHSPPRHKRPDRQPLFTKSPIREEQQDTRGDFKNVYGSLSSIIHDVPRPMEAANLVNTSNNMSSFYGHPFTNAYHPNMSNVYGPPAGSFYSHSSQVYNNSGSFPKVEDKYCDIPVDKNQGPIDDGRNSLEEDMAISPTDTTPW